MGSSRMSLRRSLLISTFAALSLFSTAAHAQGNNKPTETTTTTTPTPTSTTAKDQKTTQTTTSKTSTTSLPALSSSTTSSSSTSTGAPPKLTGLPTLSKTVDNSVPTYPPPSPPPMQNAPFMNRSTLPDGTVFIAVGAILGLFGAAILIWRGIVAYLLKRSVEKAALAQHTTNDKVASSFPPPPETFYKYTDESSASLGLVSGRGQRRTTRGPIPSQTPSTTNLFFSPTAAGGAGGGGSMNSSNRHSTFLPSGFYAATSAAPAPAGQGHGPSISLSNLNPAGNRGSHVPVRQTPPESPELAPRTTPPHGHPVRANNFSTSSISLNRPPSGRAPSAYLDDLLDDQPGAFPPAAPQGGGGHYRGASGQQPRF
ncbi:Vacuolar membrane protein [Coniochaeta hoffmannii]|uniref:Vacuolar membrane protein n=1 Tax=Coniochaeta hoffmannii TaxID=91930 RepID=A0AA38VCD7_9PEZI|nr:Vacuolar membrane protein [Coniochaeta hoffmannii]